MLLIVEPFKVVVNVFLKVFIELVLSKLGSMFSDKFSMFDEVFYY
jgi:hypothetical protein